VRGLLIALGLAALLVAGCGGGGGSTTTRPTTTSALDAARAEYRALADRYNPQISALNRELESADRAGDVAGVHAGFRRMAVTLGRMRADLAAIDFPPALGAPARAAGLALAQAERLARRAAVAPVAELRAIAPGLASAFSRLTGQVAVLRSHLGLPAPG
jgi:hypothetical protein